MDTWHEACYLRYFDVVEDAEQARQFFPFQYFCYAKRHNNRPFCGVVDIDSILHLAPIVPDLNLDGTRGGLFKMNEDAWVF
jgi:hypothetical protein